MCKQKRFLLGWYDSVLWNCLIIFCVQMLVTINQLFEEDKLTKNLKETKMCRIDCYMKELW